MLFIEVSGGVVNSVSTTTQEEADFISRQGVLVVYDDEEGTEEVIRRVIFKNGSSAEAVVHAESATVSLIERSEQVD